jgi:glycosyltransferase involved in cell wall biosynthesis
MKVMLATLALNEMEHLQNLYDQHKNWEGLVSWVFVEASDPSYEEANPELVSYDGLSTDGSTEFLINLAKRDSRVLYIRHGRCSGTKDNAKAEARQRYLDAANYIKPDFIVVLDADEFFCIEDQQRMNRLFERKPEQHSFIIPYREIWRPESIINQPLFQYEVVDGPLWGIVHCHLWRWHKGMRHSWHTSMSEADGSDWPPHWNFRDHQNVVVPQCIHLGFASKARYRKAKNAYYIQRGEGKGDGRHKYVECRRAFETWKPGDALPHDSRVIPYVGPIPEVFLKLGEPTSFALNGREGP